MPNEGSGSAGPPLFLMNCVPGRLPEGGSSDFARGALFDIVELVKAVVDGLLQAGNVGVGQHGHEDTGIQPAQNSAESPAIAGLVQVRADEAQLKIIFGDGQQGGGQIAGDVDRDP